MLLRISLFLAVCTALAVVPGRAGSAQTPGENLTAEESRQLDRLGDLYAEIAQQIAEAQARLKVLSDMQQKVNADFQDFQARVLAARGFKPGQAVLDLQLRKVIPAPKAEEKKPLEKKP